MFSNLAMALSASLLVDVLDDHPNEIVYRLTIPVERSSGTSWKMTLT
jgi:hypothetical protein